MTETFSREKIAREAEVNELLQAINPERQQGAFNVILLRKIFNENPLLKNNKAVELQVCHKKSGETRFVVWQDEDFKMVSGTESGQKKNSWSFPQTQDELDEWKLTELSFKNLRKFLLGQSGSMDEKSAKQMADYQGAVMAINGILSEKRKSSEADEVEAPLTTEEEGIVRYFYQIFGTPGVSSELQGDKLVLKNIGKFSVDGLKTDAQKISEIVRMDMVLRKALGRLAASRRPDASVFADFLKKNGICKISLPNDTKRDKSYEVAIYIARMKRL